MISGVSSGAIVGAFIAFGKKPDEIDQCDKVIAINVFPHEKTNKIGNLIEVARRTFELSIGIDRELVQKECDLLIEPAGLAGYNILDTSRAEELYNIGYDYCKNVI